MQTYQLARAEVVERPLESARLFERPAFLTRLKGVCSFHDDLSSAVLGRQGAPSVYEKLTKMVAFVAIHFSALQQW